MSRENKVVLRVGEIPYANLFPIYYYLKGKCSGYKFIRGVPSELNRKLRNGHIDVSSSSSIEYLRHKEKYEIIPDSSISASGPVGSIYLFSKLPLDKLEGRTIAVSSDSDTSVVLLKIILGSFYSQKCRFVKTDNSNINKMLSSHVAALLIGDKAMKAKKIVTRYERRETSKKSPSLPFVYDLGEVWFKYTGLPFVFALWIVRKNALSEKKKLIGQLTSDLILARKYALKRLPSIAKESPHKKWLSEKELIAYWRGISYDLTEKHIEGLKLFEKYAREY
ncbi:MAG: menaquinone biosynthesis protein [Nitrospirae bacterium]|nr:menaquinone biosynthesis protein [Nitrospirota bacterium]